MGGLGLRHPQIGLLRSQLDQEVMTKGVKLSGRVVNAAGKPIPGARISESSDGMTFLTYNRHTETDAEGRFHFHFNPNEKVTLTAQVKGYEPDTKSLVVKHGIEPIEFRLEPGRVIRGRVVDLSGKPIPAASIIIPVRSSHQGVFLRTWTDYRGAFPLGQRSVQGGGAIDRQGRLRLDRTRSSFFPSTMRLSSR